MDRAVSRWQFHKEMRKHPLIVGVLVIYSLLGFLSIVPLVLPPDKAHKFSLYPFLPKWGWPGWVIGFLILLIVLGFESWYQFFKHQKQEIAKLETEIVEQEKIASRAEHDFHQRAGRIEELEHLLHVARGELEPKKRELADAYKKIEALIWPADRPQISFHAWAERQLQFMPPGTNDPVLLAQKGFYLANDGGAALEITVENFRLNKELVVLGGTIPRIEGKTEGFVPVWIKDEVPLSKWELEIALERAWKHKVDCGEIGTTDDRLQVPVSVVYRDYNQLWYRTRAQILFTHRLLGPNWVQFSASTQERLGNTQPVLQEDV